MQLVLGAAVKKLAREFITDEEIKKVVQKEIGSNLDDSVLLQIAKNAQVSFIRDANKSLDDLVQNDEIQERIEDLKELVKTFQKENQNREAWRPIGEPEIDSFGHIRKSLLTYENRLKDSKTLLTKEIEGKTRKLKNLRAQLERSALVGDIISMRLPRI